MESALRSDCALCVVGRVSRHDSRLSAPLRITHSAQCHIFRAHLPPLAPAMVAHRTPQHGGHVRRREARALQYVAVERSRLAALSARIGERLRDPLAIPRHLRREFRVCAATVVAGTAQVLVGDARTTVGRGAHGEHRGPRADPLVEPPRKVSRRRVARRPPASVIVGSLAPDVVPIQRHDGAQRHAHDVCEPRAQVLLLAAQPPPPPRVEDDLRRTRAPPPGNAAARRAAQLEDDCASRAAVPAGAHRGRLVRRRRHLAQPHLLVGRVRANLVGNGPAARLALHRHIVEHRALLDERP
mmetsp:Transcript_50249/g.148287  ORF Transcript_50249/g.148287 Transcript_50249/m.148287 type:complete len:299 (+) Transcript_50249:299-1195(+)